MGGQSAPSETSDWEISADVPGKERQGEKGKWSRKEGKSRKGRLKIENGILKTTKICFVSTEIGIFYREKAFHAGKKIRKKHLAPSEKYSSYAPEGHLSLTNFKNATKLELVCWNLHLCSVKIKFQPQKEEIDTIVMF